MVPEPESPVYKGRETKETEPGLSVHQVSYLTAIAPLRKTTNLQPRD